MAEMTTADQVESNKEESATMTSAEEDDMPSPYAEKNAPVPVKEMMPTPEKRAGQVYQDAGVAVGMPSKGEVWAWYMYELCSYFVHTILVPVLFPLFISQIKQDLKEPPQGWGKSYKGLFCKEKEMKLYQALTYRSINVGSSKFSAVELTSLSWAIGLILAAPILSLVSTYLDHGRIQVVIPAAAIAIGSLFCLPTGFFHVHWIFPPYIVIIVAANVVATAAHTRQLGPLVRGFTGPTVHRSQFQLRRGVSSWLSLFATAAGGLGSALIAAFIYHMLSSPDKVLGLWVVSIFSGLIWIAGLAYVFLMRPGAADISSLVPPIAHFLTILKYPHALGCLIVGFLSSFTTMCIFTSAVLYLLGQLCFKPPDILYLWVIYFVFPAVSLPLMQPLQHAMKVHAEKMHLLGFLLSIAVSGAGFYFRKSIWERGHVLFFAGLQGTSVGLLHAFGRVLLIDCSPNGKEGAFSSWYSLWKALGTFAGFAVASRIPGNVSTSFGIAFCTSICGALVLIYGKISDIGGAMVAGHVSREDVGEEEAGGSPVHGLDTSLVAKENPME